MRTMFPSPSFYALIDSKLHAFTHLSFTPRFHTPLKNHFFSNFFFSSLTFFVTVFLPQFHTSFYPPTPPQQKNGPTLFRISPFLSVGNLSKILQNHLRSFSTLLLDEHTIFRISHLHALQIIVFCFHIFACIHFLNRS